jgi:hypothetical protein
MHPTHSYEADTKKPGEGDLRVSVVEERVRMEVAVLTFMFLAKRPALLLSDG